MACIGMYTAVYNPIRLWSECYRVREVEGCFFKCFSHSILSPPSRWKCKCGTVCPPSWPKLVIKLKPDSCTPSCLATKLIERTRPRISSSVAWVDKSNIERYGCLGMIYVCTDAKGLMSLNAMTYWPWYTRSAGNSSLSIFANTLSGV